MSKKTKDITIPEGLFQGYYWMSDQDKPVIIDNNIVFHGLTMPADGNPFIIEAQLFDVEHNISYSVRFSDGEYIVTKTSVAEFVSPSVQTYLASWDAKVKLKFALDWREEKDPLCEGMAVLTPSFFCFIGFEK